MFLRSESQQQTSQSWWRRLCLNSSLTGNKSRWNGTLNLFMSFGPKPTDMARFRNTPVTTILDQIQPTSINNLTYFNIASQSPNHLDASQLIKSQISACFLLMEKHHPLQEPGTDLNMDIVDDDRKAAEEAAILAAARARKQEKEDRILSTLTMTYLKFPRTEDVEKGKWKLLVIHAHNAHQLDRVFEKIPSPSNTIKMVNRTFSKTMFLLWLVSKLAIISINTVLIIWMNSWSNLTN